MSSSEKPRMATALIFTGSKPASLAARIPSITCSKPGRRVNCSKRAASMVSRLMLIRLRPAARSVRATGASKIPLVVSPTSLSPGMRRQFFDERRQVAPNQRLAAGQANLIDSQGHRDPHQADNLLEGEELGARQELDLLGHAVDAPDVAPVGHTDPQVVVPSPVGIDQLLRFLSHDHWDRKKGISPIKVE